MAPPFPAVETSPSKALLEVKHLTAEISTFGHRFRILNDINLSIGRGKIIGLLGESGCGKSLTAQILLGLIDPPLRLCEGEILWEGKNLLALREDQWRTMRGRKISLIFQDPAQAVNPYLKIGYQMVEQILCHEKIPQREAKERTFHLLEKVGLPEPQKIFENYSHELSGGMRQRALIAMGLASEPQLLIADEPTSALDSPLQGQVLHLLADESRRRQMAILFISHDIALLQSLCSEIYVMYGGRICESGPTKSVIESPRHPYTKGLIECQPQIGRNRERLPTIDGEVPPAPAWEKGCPFYNRCPQSLQSCTEQFPDRFTLPHARPPESPSRHRDAPEPLHRVACFNPLRDEHHGF